MTTLVVNGRFLNQPVTGVQRFAIEVCKELVRLVPEIAIVVPKGTNSLYDDLRPHLKYYGSRSGTLWEQTDLVSFMKQFGGLLLNLCNTAPLCYHKSIVTIHDLGIYKNRKWYDRKFVWWYRFLTPRILKDAVSVLTVSRFSKREIQRVFDIGSNQIQVVYNGLPRGMDADIDIKKEKVILHVGTFSQRKNVKFIIDAFKRSRPEGYQLILCGNEDSNLPHDLRYFQSSDSIKFMSNLSDAELTELYSKASYFICASHYEGFGLPVLESILNGATPILSDIPVFRELYDQGSLFFNPEKLNELVAIFSNLPDECNQPTVEQMNTYKEKFSYETSARTIIKLINSL